MNTDWLKILFLWFTIVLVLTYNPPASALQPLAYRPTKQQAHLRHEQLERLRRYALYTFRTNPKMWTQDNVDRTLAVIVTLDTAMMKLAYAEATATS